MSDQQAGMSDAFRAFMHEASGHAEAWMGAIRGLDAASALDKKTEELAHLAVLAALRLESGVPLHVQLAKEGGPPAKRLSARSWSDCPSPDRASRKSCLRR